MAEFPEFIKLPALSHSHSSPEELERQTLAYYARRHLKTSKISNDQEAVGAIHFSIPHEVADFDAFLVETDVDLVRHEINKSLPLSRLKYSDRSVAGFWSQKLPNYFVVSAGRLDFKQGLRVGEEPFLITGWSGCGRDYSVLKIEEDGRQGFLVVPDTFFWNCPLCFKILRIILRGLGIASSLHSSRFGANPVNPFLIPFSSFCLIQILFSFRLFHPSWRWNKLEGVDKFYHGLAFFGFSIFFFSFRFLFLSPTASLLKFLIS